MGPNVRLLHFKGEDTCYFHSPEWKERRRAAQAKGGAKASAKIKEADTVSLVQGRARPDDRESGRR
jgi:hypothetical protein